VGEREKEYLAQLLVAIDLLERILSESNDQTIDLEELVESAISRSKRETGSTIERQTFGDAILHGSSIRRLKVNLSSSGVTVHPVTKIA
jgi:hypothetical protein